MALFRKRTAAPAEPAARPRFGPGRRLASEHDLRTCVTTISGVLDVHAPTKYKYMPTLYDAAVIWHGEKPLPAEAWSCSYGADDIFVIVLWPTDSGTEIALFPLGGREESLNTPFIGQWKRADVSLRSIGLIEGGQLTLLPPELDRTYYEEILRLAGKAVTDVNIEILTREIAFLFTLKAREAIAGIGRDERGADRFVDRHGWTGDLSLPQRVLNDLGEWNYTVVPYLQDLPWRVRGMLLEPGPDGTSKAVVWQRM
jgi:hypothetical protein